METIGTPTINLDQLVSAALLERRQAEQEAAQRTAQTKKQAQQALIDALRVEFEQDFGVDLVVALKIEFGIVAGYQTEVAAARFSDAAGGPTVWELRLTNQRRSTELVWTRALHDGLSFLGSREDSYRRAEARMLLLADIGRQRAGHAHDLELKAAKTAEQAEQQRLWHIQNEERETREAAAEQLRQAEEARLQAIVDDARDTAQAALWRWPVGVEVAIYRVRWCAGSYRDGDETIFDYDEAWSATDATDAAGWWTFHVRSTLGDPKIRALRLSAEQHKPTVERFDLGSTKDAQERGLTESLSAEAQGVRWVGYEYGVGGHLIEDPEGSYAFTLSDGRQPVDWIRELVDAEDAQERG